MANPFVTSSMVWDPDINPEGIAEQFKHTFSFSVGGGSPSEAGGASMSKDGKTVVTPPPPAEPKKITVDLFVNFAQFVYDDPTQRTRLVPRPAGYHKTIPSSSAGRSEQK